MKNLLLVCIFSLLCTVLSCQSEEPADLQPDQEAAQETPSEPAAVEGEVLLTGTFEGRSDHKVAGAVSVLKTDSGYALRLEGDFSLDGAPNPKLGFGKDGYDASTQFSDLKNLSGLQVYALPESLDPTGFNEVWVWCQKFDVPLGVAKLSAETE